MFRLLRKNAKNIENAPSNLRGHGCGISIENWHGDLELPAEDHRELLKSHMRIIVGLKRECGLEDGPFDRLIYSVIQEYAKYVHLLPATRSLNHKEKGGMLKFSLESAFIAFRQADGKLFRHDAIGNNRNRHDQAWRYAAFIGTLLYYSGRIMNWMKVANPNTPNVWNPYSTSLSDWLADCGATEYEVMWEEGLDAKPWHLNSLWLTNSIVPHDVFDYLANVDINICHSLVDMLGSRTPENNDLMRLAEISTSAITNLYFSSNSKSAVNVGGVTIEGRIVDSMRSLIKEEWEINKPGSRIWITKQGVFVVWNPAIMDIQLRLKAKSITGVPENPETIAEILSDKKILIANPYRTNKSYEYKISVLEKGIPKMPLSVVRIAEPGDLGIETSKYKLLEVEVSGMPNGIDIDRPDLFYQEMKEDHVATSIEEVPMNLGEEYVSPDSEDNSLLQEIDNISVSNSPQSFENDRDSVVERKPEPTGALKRYGCVGEVLNNIKLDIRRGRWKEPEIKIEESGISISYPFVIKNYDMKPDEFISECKKKHLIKSERNEQVALKSKGNKRIKVHYIVFPERIKDILIGGSDE